MPEEQSLKGEIATESQTTEPSRRFAFIDRANIDRTTKDILKFSIDWQLLYNHLTSSERKWKCEKVFIYTGAKETEAQDKVAELTRMGYEPYVRASRPQRDKVREHSYQCTSCGADGKVRVVTQGAIKSNCDVSLTVDAMQHIPKADEILLLTGDGDFDTLILHAMNQGVHVRIVSNTGRDHRGDKTFSTRLQTILDEEGVGENRASFIDINDWKESICIKRKPPSSVAAPERT